MTDGNGSKPSKLAVKAGCLTGHGERVLTCGTFTEEEYDEELDISGWWDWLSGEGLAAAGPVLQYGLDPLKRYTLSTSPDSAIFLRISHVILRTFKSDPDKEVLALRLYVFSHDGDYISTMEMTQPEHLISYPFSQSNPPSPEALERERVLIKNVMAAEQRILAEHDSSLLDLANAPHNGMEH